MDEQIQFQQKKNLPVDLKVRKHLPTHFGSLLRFDQMPDFFPPHVLIAEPLTSKPGSQIKVQFDPCTTF